MVTVGIPVYNQKELIIRALESIPKRDDIEIVVVDDGSDDGTWDKLTDYFSKHEEINSVLLYNEENKGVANAVNRILDNANGDYFVQLDSDDYFYTDKFEECMKQLDGKDMVYFDIQINNGDIWKVSPANKRKMCGSVKFIRRELIKDTRCKEGLRVAEDKDLYEKLLKKNPTEKFTGIVVKHYNYPREGSLVNIYEKELVEQNTIK